MDTNQEWLHVDPKVKTLWILEAVLGVAVPVVLMLVIAGVLAFIDVKIALLLLAIGIGFASVLGVLVVLPWIVYTQLAYRNLSYRVGDHDVGIRRGILFRTETHIPLARIQDVVVKQGPLMRMFGLGTLHLQTAAMVVDAQGQRSGEGMIPGIRAPQEAAAQLLVAIRNRTERSVKARA